MDSSSGLSLTMVHGHQPSGQRDVAINDDKCGIDLVQGGLAPTTLSLLGQTLSFNGQHSDGSNQSGFPMSSQNLQGLGRNVDSNRQLGYGSPVQEQVSGLQLSQQLGQAAALSNLLGSNSGSQQGASSSQALMNSLNLLQQNIGALQALVPLISQSSQQAANGMQSQQLQQQQAAASAGVAAVISQLAVAAAGILPQVGGSQQDGQQFQNQRQNNNMQQQNVQSLLGSMSDAPFAQFLGGNQLNQGFSFGGQGSPQQNSLVTVQEKNEDADGYVETLPEGSYDVVEMDPVEIMAEHTHFCEICGKGFKRDANLRMHMRGHGDEYKTPAALSRPDKHIQDLANSRPKRFSCPYVGCKRNKKHKKFQPLKTMLCVKNHYRRSHCPKMLTCSKCNAKRFSVVADLKTHEKHCGRDKWMCSCRTTFSRKDKLLGHLSLFAGHTPAMPLHVMEEGINNSGSGTSNNSNHLNNMVTTASIGNGENHSTHNQDIKIQDTTGLRHVSSPDHNSGNSGGFGQILGGANLFNNSSLLQGLFTTNFLDNNGSNLR